MKKFTVEICRTSFATHNFEVKANTEEEAIQKAKELAYNTEFTEYNVQYSIEGVETYEKEGK